METRMENPVYTLLQNRHDGREKGVYACCSANEYVIRAAMRRAAKYDTVVLVEATANQVNQDGGYTGMTPADFRKFLERLAAEEQFPIRKVLCGGDHLGPLTWRQLPEEQAMTKAEELVRAYLLAGFSKIHLDTSMRLADDDRSVRLSDDVIARRGARLCRAAEDAFTSYVQKHPGAPAPVYVIGSEVPVPGGAQENEDSVSVTSPADCEAVLEAYRYAFAEQGLKCAWQRVVALVVQPGVEFADESVVEYNRSAAESLIKWLGGQPGLVFEGHSTDYQPPDRLRQMVEDGIAILKVGPGLTFALREGLFALEKIEQELQTLSHFTPSAFRATLEFVMQENDDHWAGYYHGTDGRNRYARAYSFSDRARYYLVDPRVEDAIQTLLRNLDREGIPLALLRQYLPVQHSRVHAGELDPLADTLLIDHVGDCIDEYLSAVLR